MKLQRLQFLRTGRRLVCASLSFVSIAILPAAGLGAPGKPAPSSANTESNSHASPASKAGATIQLTRSPEFVTIGSPVTFTAVVSGTAGVIPTGAVVFTSGASILGAAALDDAGVATFTFSHFGIGGHGIVAAYEGDSNYNSAVSAVVDISDDGALRPTLVLTATATRAKKGVSVVLTASVTGSGPQPTGELYFYDSATPDDTITVRLNGSGAATYTPVTERTGSYTITAVYSGDDNYQSQTSSALVVLVTEP
jgi:hypothetical protein